MNDPEGLRDSNDQSSDQEVLAWLRAHWLPLILFALIAAAALPIIEHTTSSGIGLRDDSFSYFSGAENLLAGRGYGRYTQLDGFKPITNFPPFYSTLLAVPQLVGLEARAAARLIAGLSFAAMVLLSGLFIYWATRSTIAAVLAQGLLLFSPALLEVNTWAHSEGPYLAIMVGALWLTAILIRRPSPGWPLIVGASFALALAVLTRYAGVVLFGLCTLSVFLFAAWGRKSKPHIGLGIPALASLPLLAFLARNRLIADSATNRPAPYWHPPDLNNLINGARTILRTFLSASFVDIWTPTALAAGAGLLFLLLILLLASSLKGRGEQHRRNRAPLAEGILSLHAVAYSAFVLFSLYFLDRLIPLNERILAPVIVNLILVGVLLIHRIAHTIPTRKAWILIPASALLLVGQISRGWPQMEYLSENGMGFSQPMWRSSQTMEYIRAQSVAPIFTNNVPAMYFLADRHASFIPSRYDPASAQPREDYEDALQRMRDVLEERDGRLVIIGPGPRNRIPPDHFRDLTTGLTLVAEFGDGLVYEATED